MDHSAYTVLNGFDRGKESLAALAIPTAAAVIIVASTAAMVSRLALPESLRSVLRIQGSLTHVYLLLISRCWQYFWVTSISRTSGCGLLQRKSLGAGWIWQPGDL